MLGHAAARLMFFIQIGEGDQGLVVCIIHGLQKIIVRHGVTCCGVVLAGINNREADCFSGQS